MNRSWMTAFSAPEARGAPDAAFAEILPRLSGFLCSICLVLSLVHLWALPLISGLSMSIGAAVAAGVFAVIAWKAHQSGFQPGRSHLIGGWGGLLLVVMAFFNLIVYAHPVQTLGFMAVIVGAGAFLNDRICFRIVLGTALFSWLLGGWYVGPHPLWLHFITALIVSSLISLLIFRNRIELFILLKQTEIERDIQKSALVQEIQDRKRAESTSQSLQRQLNERGMDAGDKTVIAPIEQADFRHDLITPAAGMISLSDMLASADLPPREREWVHVMGLLAEYLRFRVIAYLDNGSAEEEDLSPNYQTLNPEKLLLKAIAVISPYARERDVAITLASDPVLPETVRGDPDWMRQILIGFLDQVIAITLSGGTLYVSAMVLSEQLIRFQIAVSGSSVPETERQWLARAMTESDAAFKREFGGWRSGLVWMRQRVERHGGSFGVNFSPSGKGCDFWCDIRFEPAVINLPGAAGGEDGAGTRVLVVEDNRVNRELLKRMLEKAGYHVLLAVNGKAALDMVAQSPVDVILMDMRMPVMDGISASRMIRSDDNKAVAEIPIIGMTAHGLKKDHEACLEAGMDLCFNKPVDIRRLKQAIADLSASPRFRGTRVANV